MHFHKSSPTSRILKKLTQGREPVGYDIKKHETNISINKKLTFFSDVPSPAIFLLLLFVSSQDHPLFFSLQNGRIDQHQESEIYFSNISSSSVVIESGAEEIDPDFSWSKMASRWENDFSFAGDNCALSCVSGADYHFYFLNVIQIHSSAL